MLIGLTTITATDTNDTTTLTETSQANTIDTTTQTNVNDDTISTNEKSQIQTDNIQETLNNKIEEKTQNLKAGSRIETATNFTDLNDYLTSDAYDTVTLNIDNDILLSRNITVNSAIKTLTINGNNKTISGNGRYRFLYLPSKSNTFINNITIINCKSNNGAINSGTYSNITITNSNLNNNNGGYGGAIEGVANSTITITGCNFTNNNANHGAAIYGWHNSTITVHDSIFTSNNVTGAGGAITGSYNSTIIITDSNFTNNEAKIGGAVQGWIDSTITIITTNFTNNKAEYGGAIQGYPNSTITVLNTNFTNNKAEYGGAIQFNQNANTMVGGVITNLTVINSTFLYNTAGYGGAIYGYTNSNITITQSNFTKNTATIGGAILTNQSIVDLTDVLFEENTANVNSTYTNLGGGAIYSENSTITIDNGTFTGNNAKNTTNRTGVNGGAIYGDNTTIIIQNSNFGNNNAITRGGAIYGHTNNNLIITNTTLTNNNGKYGGAVYSGSESNISIINSILTHNTVNISGGAIYSNINSNITITQSNLTNNNATQYGGAIYGVANSTITINNTKFTQNTANNGGAIYYEEGIITITNTNLTHNNATGSNGGGAIYGHRNTTIIVQNSNLTNNNASSGGAIYGFRNTTIIVQNSNLTHNTGGSGGAIVGNNITVQNSNLTHNTGYYGIIYTFPITATFLNSSITITHSNLTNNSAHDGGVIYGNSNSTISIIDSNLTNNTAYDGGAIFASTNSTLIITNSNLTNNNATNYGGAIYGASKGTITINNTQLTNNKANYGGAINTYINNNITITQSNITQNTAWHGGAILSSTNSNITITQSNLTHNNATNYGVIYGGTNSTITINNTQLTNNKAWSGGTILTYGNITLKNSHVADNYVTGYSKYVVDFSNANSINITDNTFINNTDYVYDMLFSDTKEGSEVNIHGNTYIDNFLKDSIAKPNIPIVTTNESTTYNYYVDVNLRSIYNDMIRDGTLNVYVNGDLKNSTNVTNGSTRIFFENSDLTKRENNITLEYITLSKHYQNTSTTFIVKKEINTSLAIQTPNKMIPGDTAVINFTLKDDKGTPLSGEPIHVLIDEEQIATVTTDENGIASYTYTASGDEVVHIEATYHTSSDSFYLSSMDAVAEINVTKLEQEMIIIPGNITPHIETNITIHLFDNDGNPIKNKTVTVNITEEGKPNITGTATTDENGTAVFNFTPIDEGTLNITVTSPEDEIYLPKTESIQVSVNLTTTNMILTATNTIINKTNTITIEILPTDAALLSGTVELNISGEIHTLNINNGRGTYHNYKSDTAGSKNVTAKFTSNTPGYTNVTLTEPFNVTKIPTRITIETINRTAGNVTLKVLVFPKENTGSIVNGGNIVIESVNGENRTVIYNNTLQNGELIYLTDINETGGYDFETTYHGNDYFLGEVNSTGSLEVTLVNTDTTTFNKNALVGETITLNATVNDVDGNPVNDGNVTFHIDGKQLYHADGTPVEAKLENGIATTDYTLPITYTKGKYLITANYNGNNKYNTSSGEAELLIDSHETTIEVTPVNNTKGNTTIEVTLNTTDDKPIPSAPITVTDENDTIIGEGITDENGTANITIEIPVGDNNITITYPGDDTYSPQNETITVNVTPRDSETTGTVTNNTAGNVTIEVQVIDPETGEPVTGPVKIIADGEVVGNDTLDEEGKSTIPLNIDKKGNYTITIEYEGNDNYKGSNDTLDDINIVGKDVDVNIVVDNQTIGNTTVNVTITDPETDEPIPNATVIVTLPNGTTVNGTTDENGTATIPIDVPVGDNNITITYPGDDTHNPQNETTTVNVTQRDSQTTGTVTNNTVGNVTIDVQIIDPITGEPVTGPVKIIIDDEVVGTGDLDENGTATIPVDIDKKGNYTITIEYEGNDDYNGSTYVINDTYIAGKDTNVTIITDNPTVGNTTVNVTITDPETNTTIPNATVIITLPNGTNITGITDENGTISIPIDVPSGDNNITITYPGDDTHETQQENITIRVKSYTTVTVDPVEGVTLDNVTFIANVRDYQNNTVTGGYVQFSVGGKTLKDENGKNIRVLVENGIAKLSYKAESGWIVDSHPNLKVQAVFTGTSLARENRSDTNKVTIYKRNATVEVSAPDDYVNGTLHIDAVVRDQNGSLINDGVLVFKLNGLSLKDENNKGIVAKVVNGKVHLDVKLPFAYSAKKYNLTATYSNKIYNKATGSNTTSLKAIPTYVNATVTIKDQFSKPVVTGQIYNKFNYAVLEGTAIINIKFDGISYAKKVKIENGTFRETLEGIPIYKPGTHKIEIAAGANSHYDAVRKTITSKTTPKYNVNTVITNITRNKTTTRVQAKIVDDKNKNVQRDLKITIKLNGKSFLVNKTVTNGIVDVLVDTSTLKNRTYNLELVSGANTYYNAGKSTAELPKY